MLCIGFLLLAACKPQIDAAKQEQAVPAETAAPSDAPAQVVAGTSGAVNVPAIIHFKGFGAATFGANEESVRMAWGKPMIATKPENGSSCFYLFPEVADAKKRGIGFMFEEDKLVRYDVQDASQISPGNFKVGDSLADIKKAFAGRVEEAPHKYIERGFTLTVTPEDRSQSRLIFEIGGDGKVLNWRIGVPPQVFYVEGCG